MTLPIDLNPWGVCVEKTCETLGLRCFHGRCGPCCEQVCKDSTGVKTHSARTVTETSHLTPKYEPKTPKLVAVTRLKEAV